MREFNLEEAKAGRPVCTRDGKDVRIICFDRQAPSPIVGLVYAEGLGEFCRIFYANGDAEDADKSNDLFMKPEKHEGWVNVYKTGNVNYSGSTIYSTREEAENGRECECVDTIVIEWEE